MLCHFHSNITIHFSGLNGKMKLVNKEGWRPGSLRSGRQPFLLDIENTEHCCQVHDDKHQEGFIVEKDLDRITVRGAVDGETVF